MKQPSSIEAYPLTWPIGYKRTADYNRHRSQFKQTMERAQRFMRDEVARIGGTDLIVSSNIPVRNDGMLYADYMRRKIDDPGVAIYFKMKGRDVVMCCDQYSQVWENVYALGKGIEALRGMDRWGVSEFLERAFTGFTALPEFTTADIKSSWETLGLSAKPADIGIVHSAYKTLAKKAHPDMGGSADGFDELNKAYQQALSQYE